MPSDQSADRINTDQAGSDPVILAILTHLDGLPMIDDGAVTGLVQMMDEDSLTKVITQLVADIETNHTLIKQALTVKSIETVATVAHRFKTLAGTFGLPAIAQAAHDIDTAKRQGQTGHVLRLARWLEAELPKAATYFANYLKTVADQKTDMKSGEM